MSRSSESLTGFIRMRNTRLAIDKPPCRPESRGHHPITWDRRDPDRCLWLIEDPNGQPRGCNSHKNGYDERDERPREYLAQAWIR